MKKFVAILLMIGLASGGVGMWLRGPLEETKTAALRAYPVYSFVRTRNEALMRAAHAGETASNRLYHKRDLATPRDRSVTTPNNDTLYSSAFLDLAGGPVTLRIPDLGGRYASVAVMDARTDNVFVLRPDAAGDVRIEFGDGVTGRVPPAGDEIVARYRVGTPQAWLLVRVLVDGPADLQAARAAQSGFVLAVPAPSVRPDRAPRILPVNSGPAELLAAANPVIAESPPLQDSALAATGYGGSVDAFDQLPAWRRWLWRIVLPRLIERMKAGIAEGSRATDDGWSRSPPGIGTAKADDVVRAAVALGGLGALPVEEAVYWSATLDSSREELSGAKSYSLTIPAPVPAGAFWSLSMYERLPDGRLFYVDNPLDRFAVGDRTPGLTRNADGSLTLMLSHAPPAGQTNWLPAPAGPFTLIFRAYVPQPPILSGAWRLPPVERAAD